MHIEVFWTSMGGWVEGSGEHSGGNSAQILLFGAQMGAWVLDLKFGGLREA